MIRPLLASILSFACVVGLGTAQQPGLTPLQVTKLRTVTGVFPNPAGEAVAFTRTEPRQPIDPPGGARVHLYMLEIDGADTRERLLIGGDRSVRGVAWDPRGGRITFVDKRDGDEHSEVYAITPDGGEVTKVTETPHGVRAFKWRPDGGAIAYTALDPLPPARAMAHQLGFKQRIVDEDFRHISLWLWDGETNESKRLTEGRTVNSFEWSPAGIRLAAGIAPRNLVDDSYMFTRLHVIDIASGAVDLLVDNPGKLGAYAWSPKGDRLAYISAADRNDPHAGMLYLVDVRSREPRALTANLPGMVHSIRWETNYKGFPNQEVIAAVISRGVHVRDLIIAPTRPRTQTQEFTLPPGSPVYFSAHGSWPEGSGRFVVASTSKHPAEVFGRGFGPGLTRLTHSNPWLDDVALGEQEVVRLNARDGVQIEGMLLYPVDYREGQRYPLVIVAHGGPEAHFSNGWNTSYGRWGQLLSARGYFAWYPNYRASTGYGVDFAKADHGDPMGKEFLDHLDAIRHFADGGIVDPERVGLGGGSYGGYTAAWAATRHTEHFAAAVSFVPFVDIRTKWYTSDIPFEFYYVHYQEMWPHEQRGMLADRSPLSYADRCRTPLLLLGGTSDTRVHPSQPFMLYRAVKFATETPVRYVQYPGEGHGNRSNVYRYDYALRTLRWFDHYLRPGDHRADAPPPFDLDYGPWGAPAAADGDR